MPGRPHGNPLDQASDSEVGFDGYPEEELLGRSFRVDEARYVTEVAQRLTQSFAASSRYLRQQVFMAVGL
jgi:hypothetical protein